MIALSDYIRFYWIWTWKYLDCDLGLQLILYASRERIMRASMICLLRLNKIFVST